MSLLKEIHKLFESDAQPESDVAHYNELIIHYKKLISRYRKTIGTIEMTFLDDLLADIVIRVEDTTNIDPNNKNIIRLFFDDYYEIPNEKIRKKHEKNYRLSEHLKRNLDNLEQKLKKSKQDIRKARKEKLSTVSQTSRDTPKDIPAKIPTSSSPSASLINNVSLYSDEDVYVGHPSKCPYWTPQMFKLYTNLNDALIRNGLEPFTEMYSSTIKGVQYGTRYNLFNFILIGAKGDFVVHKRDTSPGSGQNNTYINGTLFKTSKLYQGANSSSKDQDRIISKAFGFKK